MINNVNKTSSTSSTLCNDDFSKYFEDLFNPTTNCVQTDDFVIDENINVPELDKNITIEEVTNAIKGLKCDTSPGLDGVMAEIFKFNFDIFGKILCELFNVIFSSGCYPSVWSKCIIVPVPKKGNRNDVNNYRGIVLVNVIAKIYSIILKARLESWADDTNLICNEQFGFRAGKSTTDCIFILHSIISKCLDKREKLYCAFIDYTKAFDRINRNYLWCKLQQYGASFKIVRSIKSMYDNVQLHVKYDNTVSPVIKSFIGVKQGEPLSPLLFLLFINDFVSSMDVSGADVVCFNSVILFTLLYADDTVLLSKSPKGLQNLLNSLSVYCKKWALDVNIYKTKIMIFCKGRQPKQLPEFVYDCSKIDIVSSFCYLGVDFYNNGRCNVMQKKISERGFRSLYKLFNIFDNINVDIVHKNMLFDCYVGSVLSYASEVWGFHKAPDIERVHLKYCKYVLSVKKTTPSVAVYGELGELPLLVKRKERILKYWINIVRDKNSFVYQIYNVLRHDADNNMSYNGLNWAYNVKCLLNSLGMSDVWLNQDSVFPCFTNMKQRIRDIYYQEWNVQRKQLSKLKYFNEFKLNFTCETYLSCISSTALQISFSRFRLSSHNLLCETGRYNNIPYDRRICTFCNMQVIENEYHFILICPIYSDLRKMYLPKIYNRWPNLQKFFSLMSSTNVKIIVNLSKFVYLANLRRESFL